MNRSLLSITGKAIKPSNHIIVDERNHNQLSKDRVRLAFKGKSLRLLDEEGVEVVVPPRADIWVNFYER